MSDAGQAFQVLPLEHGLVELRFDLPGESVNKFNAVALASLKRAVEELRARKGLRGVLLTSGKDVFCVGADITEFLAHFEKSEAELTRWVLEADAVFSALEDLDAPCRRPSRSRRSRRAGRGSGGRPCPPRTPSRRRRPCQPRSR